jgi:hypothetical protein
MEETYNLKLEEKKTSDFAFSIEDVKAACPSMNH